MSAAAKWTLVWLAWLVADPRPVDALLRDRAPPSLAGPSPAAGAEARLSVVDWNAYDEREQDGPGTYSFGYEIEDPASGNTQFRQEERFANGTVAGSYGLLEPDGNVRVVSYVADERGYRARVENSMRRAEDFPRKVPPVTPPPPRPRRPEEWTSGRVQLANASGPQQGQGQHGLPAAPLAWALVALQEGRRPPVQEQRVRPASAASSRRRAAPTGQKQPQQPQQQQVQQQQRQQQQQQQQQIRQQQQGEQQQQQKQQQQQRQQVYSRGEGSEARSSAEARPQPHAPLAQVSYFDSNYPWAAWAAAQGGEQGPGLIGSYYGDLSSNSAPGVVEDFGDGNHLGDDRAADWRADPIVVWATPSAPQGRYQLPPNPLLDSLIYKKK